MNQPVLARQQAQQATNEQLTGNGAAAGHIFGATQRDPDFDRLLQREWSPREVLEEDNLTKMLKVAEMLASSKVSVPDHLRGNVGDCLAIVTQAMLWNMNPFAVAQKTHLVNGRLGYEAQLVNAVLQASGLVRGLPRYEYRGDGEGLECRVAFIPRGETEPLWGEWLPMRSVTTRNSPLWKTNQRQQLGYLQIKNWARAFAPGAILGVYTVDELENDDFTPPAQTVRTGPQRKSAGNPPPPASKRDDTPDPETGEVAPPATRAPAPPSTTSTGNRIKEGQANYLRNKLKEAGASEQETCERYGVARLEDLTLDAWDERRAELLAG